MNRPKILMSARESFMPAYHIRMYSNIDSYDHYIRKAGGMPFTYRADSLADAKEAAQAFDGLLLSGGADMNPSLYNAENLYSSCSDPEIDASDLWLYQAFKEAGKPVLAICRGMQAAAVAEGSCLIQDIPSQGCYHNHNQRNDNPPVPNHCFYHSCTFQKGTRLHEIMGDAYMVNSFHHQAVVSVPEGFIESGRSDDGIIEAIECGNIICVQWHPERLSQDEKHMKIAEMFVCDCLSGKAG